MDPSWHVVQDILNDPRKDSLLRGCDVVTMFVPTRTNRTNSNWLRCIDSCSNVSSLSPPPYEVTTAIESTHRWSSHFVRPLHLCPWAGSSLDTFGAIRYWVVLMDPNVDEDSSVVLEEMERMIRYAAMQLEQITNKEDPFQTVDASVAISFVVFVPFSTGSSKSMDTTSSRLVHPSLEFESFHEFFVTLEDRFLEEYDAYLDSIDDDSDPPTVKEIPVGCNVTIAAFHPHWRFNTLDPTAIDWEKRTPYPTISLVMSSAIDALIDETEDTSSSAVTTSIATSNEKTLCKFGSDRLKELFDTDVIGKEGGTKGGCL